MLFSVVLVFCEMRTTYSHQHDASGDLVRTPMGQISLTVHLQQDAHDSSPDQASHTHDSGATHLPAVVGTCGCNVQRSAGNTSFFDFVCWISSVSPDSLLRPPTIAFAA